jgi:hypothetical protein
VIARPSITDAREMSSAGEMQGSAGYSGPGRSV